MSNVTTNRDGNTSNMSNNIRVQNQTMMTHTEAVPSTLKHYITTANTEKSHHIKGMSAAQYNNYLLQQQQQIDAALNAGLLTGDAILHKRSESVTHQRPPEHIHQMMNQKPG